MFCRKANLQAFLDNISLKKCSPKSKILICRSEKNASTCLKRAIGRLWLNCDSYNHVLPVDCRCLLIAWGISTSIKCFLLDDDEHYDVIDDYYMNVCGTFDERYFWIFSNVPNSSFSERFLTILIHFGDIVSWARFILTVLIHFEDTYPSFFGLLCNFTPAGNYRTRWLQQINQIFHGFQLHIFLIG